MNTFEDATVQERYEALKTLLGTMKLEFVKTRQEQFPKKSHGQEIHRQHYRVLLGNADFDYFQGEKLKPSNDFIASRVVSFFWGILLDYGLIANGEIKDAIDLVTELGVKPTDARESFPKLQSNYNKVALLFTEEEIEQLQAILEGY